MSFRDINNIQLEYQTKRQKVITEFYVPCLNQTVLYKRAVGYFSSSILVYISDGLINLAKKNGHAQLLVSPSLDEKDYQTIKKGYELRDYVHKKLIDEFESNEVSDLVKDNYALLAYMIANGTLDIKVSVVLDSENDNSIYHEKMGIMQDEEDNIICFSGSSNETYNGFIGNYDSIDVFCDWKSKDDFERCNNKKNRFDRMWENKEPGLQILDFPEVIKNKILSFKRENLNLIELDRKILQKYIEESKKNIPSIEKVGFYKYQEEAINNWEKNGFCGIFDMATGTGKTYTGCGAIERLYSIKKRLIVIISCPFIPLVNQWAEEVQKFNIDPLVCYGNTNYITRLKRLSYQFRHKQIDFFCILVTNASFIKDDFQRIIHSNIQDTLLLVDEAHNFGAENISRYMLDEYPYRLALSATLDRFNDIRGTNKLHNFFGDVCISYDLRRAIIEDKLTHYKYYPIVVSLNENELEDYIELSEKIKKYHYDKDGEMPEGLKKLLIRRARVVSGARNKIGKLVDIISEKYQNDKNLLIYCGDVKYNENGIEEKQIDLVCDQLVKSLGMKVSKFTSSETTEERRYILDKYKNGELQSLVAIKCLDEGMNIPAIKTAFILASSINPKQYIQRRGRVLRKHPGKKYAEIYDFITLPVPLSLDYNYINSTTKSAAFSLVKKELARMMEFADLSDNPSQSNELRDQIKEFFEIDKILEEDLYEF